ncbi:MAG: ComF family protein [Ignavibacteria bacterium]|nr:ComF family protein [Ignavibacteria bacterium]
MMRSGETNLFTSLLDLFLPRFCCACKVKLASNEDTMCTSCLTKIQTATEERLKREFDRKFLNKNIVSDFFSVFVFEKDKELQHAIHSLKYENKFPIGIFLGKTLANKIKCNRPDWDIDLIIPIPLHQLKKAERGYNQSFYIAKGIGNILDITFSDRVVKRIKYTQSQTTMTLNEREENISGAFRVRKKTVVKGKNILLVDDVITTAATISECGKILIEEGAKDIYAASIAIAD